MTAFPLDELASAETELLLALRRRPVDWARIRAAARPGLLAAARTVRKSPFLFFEIHRAAARLGSAAAKIFEENRCDGLVSLRRWRASLAGPACPPETDGPYRPWLEAVAALPPNLERSLPWIEAFDNAMAGDPKWLKACLRHAPPGPNSWRRVIQACSLASSTFPRPRAQNAPVALRLKTLKTVFSAADPQALAKAGPDAIGSLLRPGNAAFEALGPLLAAGARPGAARSWRQCAAAALVLGRKGLAKRLQKERPDAFAGFNPALESVKTLLQHWLVAPDPQAVFAAAASEAAARPKSGLAGKILRAAAFHSEAFEHALRAFECLPGFRLPPGTAAPFWAVDSRGDDFFRQDKLEIFLRLEALGCSIPGGSSKRRLDARTLSWIEERALAADAARRPAKAAPAAPRRI